MRVFNLRFVISLVIALGLSSCLSIETKVFIESRAQSLPQASMNGFLKYNDEYKAVDVLKLEDATLYFHQTIHRYTSSWCIGTVLIIPIDLELKNETDLAKEYAKPMAYTIEVGFDSRDGGVDVNFGNVSLEYKDNFYKPTSVVRMQDRGMKQNENGLLEVSSHIDSASGPVWYELNFEVMDFDPNIKFVLRMGEVRSGRGSVSIKPIVFGPQEVRYTSDHGERGC